MAYFSEFFITLHLKDTGISLAWLPMLVVSMNLVHALSAFPFGKLSDSLRGGNSLHWASPPLFVWIFFAFSTSLLALLVGIFLIGAHMGITRGLIRVTLVEHVPANLQGTAYAVFYFLTGFSLLAANILAGKFSELYGSKDPL